jgi:membrane protein YdbS with pleckstrin-like domain
MSENNPLSTNMRVAISLLYVFIIGIIIALIVTEVNVPHDIQLLALTSVTSFIALGIVFIYYCRQGKKWSFAGDSILGASGVALRVTVSLLPNLEVGGGLPAGVSTLYMVLGSLVSLKSYESYLELKASKTTK